jgi:hypothetical protein
MKALLGAAQPQASLVDTPVVVMCVLRSEVMVCVWSKDKPGKVVELEAAWARWWGSRGDERGASPDLLVAHAGHTATRRAMRRVCLVSSSVCLVFSLSRLAHFVLCPSPHAPHHYHRRGALPKAHTSPPSPRQRRLPSSASTRTPDSTRHHEPPAACPTAPPSRPTGSLLLRLGHGKQPPRMRALLCCQHGPTTQGQHPRDPVKPG